MTTATTSALLDHLGGANRISAMTGAQIMTGAADAHLVFPRQTGRHKLTHLVIRYDAATDLYNLSAYRMNRKTLQCPIVATADSIFADQLKAAAESMTGLAFTL
jgi:hypothetical protein